MKLSPGYSLESVLQRRNNNLDLFRLVAAVMVIFGHSYLFPTGSQPPASWDIFTFFRYPGVYCGSIAVKLFFFISGLVVTDSLLRKGSVPGFLLARFFRLWPALAVLLVLTAFVAGPLLTDWDVASYLRDPATRGYVMDNLLFNPGRELPGLFPGNPRPQEVNGALWTLRYEVAAYAWLLVCFVLGVARRRWICALLLVLVYVDPLLPHPLLPTSQTGNPQIAYLPCCFVLGACLACWKKKIVLRWEYVLALAALLAVFRSSLLGPHLLILTVLVSVLHLSATPLLLRLRPPADLSYGIYLWGFPVQQVVAQAWGDGGFALNFMASLLGAALLALASWRWVERPAIALGSRLAAALPSGRASSHPEC
jgi:peptidoglycan/LPS O-acetylase OafA/YrhL